MTELRLTITQPYVFGHMEAGAMVTVRRLSDLQGHMTAWWTNRKAVDVEGDTARPQGEAVFQLPSGGRYGITVTRPRATDLEREFVVNEGEQRRETVTLEGSPHEYLGWQQFAGIVKPLAIRQRVAFESSPTPPLLFSTALPKGRDGWELKLSADLLVPAPGLNWPRDEDAEFTMWSPPAPGGEGYALIDRLRQPEDPFQQDPLSVKFPRWVAVRGEHTLDLISMPWAWFGGTQNPGEGLRIVYTRHRPNALDSGAIGHSVVTALDSRWFSLLEFLSANRLGAAGDLVDEVLGREGPDFAEMALDGKVKGPMVAVAGALVLVIRTTTPQPQRWDRWLENLSNWFEGIPDGPIILAYRRLSQAKTAADLDQVYKWLSIGISRGIPYFAATVRMLAQALAQLGADVPQADEDRRFIASISSRVDPNQPFTVIHP